MQQCSDFNEFHLIGKRTFIKTILYSFFNNYEVHCFKNSTNSILFICHNNPVRSYYYPPFNKGRNRHKVHFKLSQGHQAVNGNAEIQIQAV